MTEEAMWLAFIKENPELKDSKYDAWSFGGNDTMANERAELVINNVKTGTTSAYEMYKMYDSPLPPVGGLNIILDAQENAICMTETTKVYMCPFNKVSVNHALREGDYSLEHWRKVHKKFFTEELAKYEKDFDEEMLVVCEEFKVIYK